MISATSQGNFNKTTQFLEMMKSGKIYSILNSYGSKGVDALSRATPIDTGETAHSWGYQVQIKPNRASINWFNTHREGKVNIAVILQYGHGTGTGGYIEGIDYINPAMRPIFDAILADVWRQVTNG